MIIPERKELKFTVKNNYVCVDVPVFKGYAVVVFEN